MEGFADADASPLTATPGPQDAPTPMLDGAELAEHQAASYAAAHCDVQAPTAASTCGRTAASPTGLGYTGSTTRIHSTPLGFEPAIAQPPTTGTAPATEAASADSAGAPELAFDPVPDGFVEHLGDLAEISSADAIAALQELRLTEPTLWHTWTSFGDTRVIAGALLPALDDIIRHTHGDNTDGSHWVPHTAVDIAIASMPDSHLMAAGHAALVADVLTADELGDAEPQADHILNDWAATLSNADRDRHRDHDASLTPAALHSLAAAANRWRCRWANTGPGRTTLADLLRISREPSPQPASPPPQPAGPEQPWTTVARRQPSRAAAPAGPRPSSGRSPPDRTATAHSRGSSRRLPLPAGARLAAPRRRPPPAAAETAARPPPTGWARSPTGRWT